MFFLKTHIFLNDHRFDICQEGASLFRIPVDEAIAKSVARLSLYSSHGIISTKNPIESQLINAEPTARIKFLKFVETVQSYKYLNEKLDLNRFLKRFFFQSDKIEAKRDVCIHSIGHLKNIENPNELLIELISK